MTQEQLQTMPDEDQQQLGIGRCQAHERECPYGKIAVIGAGAVGATYAYTMVRSGVAQEIILVDVDRERARGEQADLSHCTPYGRQVDVFSGDYADCEGAGLVVITAGVPQRTGDSRLDLVGRNVEIFKTIIPAVVKAAPQALLLIVTNPVDIMTQVSQRLSGLPPERVIGSGTVLDSARLRSLVAEFCGADSRDVQGHVIGEHGDSEVVAWSSVNVGAVPLDDFCRDTGRLATAEVRRDLAQRTRDAAYFIIERKGATQFAVATALEVITNAILLNQDSLLTVSSQVQGIYGLDDVCLSIPCVVNRRGIARQVELHLSNDELAALGRSAAVLRDMINSLEV